MLIAADGTPPLSLLATAKVTGISVTVIPLLSSGHPPVIILNDRYGNLFLIMLLCIVIEENVHQVFVNMSK